MYSHSKYFNSKKLEKAQYPFSKERVRPILPTMAATVYGYWALEASLNWDIWEDKIDYGFQIFSMKNLKCVAARKFKGSLHINLH